MLVPSVTEVGGHLGPQMSPGAQTRTLMVQYGHRNLQDGGPMRGSYGGPKSKVAMVTQRA